MHCRIALAVCLPMALAAHSDASAQSVRTRALVRSADSTQQVAMRVQLTGSLLASLGPARLPGGPRVGEVALYGDGHGTATTPAALEASDRVGGITFTAPASGPELEITVPGTSLRAQGRVVRLVRDQAGAPLRAEALPEPDR
jgi:hypothetical protein